MAPVLMCPFPEAVAAEHGGTLHSRGMQGTAILLIV